MFSSVFWLTFFVPSVSSMCLVSWVVCLCVSCFSHWCPAEQICMSGFGSRFWAFMPKWAEALSRNIEQKHPRTQRRPHSVVVVFTWHQCWPCWVAMFIWFIWLFVLFIIHGSAHQRSVAIAMDWNLKLSIWFWHACLSDHVYEYSP